MKEAGIEVKIAGSDLTAFIKRAELARDRADQRPERFAVGDKFDARVTLIDRRARKVTVSIKALEIAEEKEAVAQYGSSDCRRLARRHPGRRPQGAREEEPLIRFPADPAFKPCEASLSRFEFSPGGPPAGAFRCAEPRPRAGAAVSSAARGERSAPPYYMCGSQCPARRFGGRECP